MKETITEIVKTLISTGRTKFLLAAGAVGGIVYLAKTAVVTGTVAGIAIPAIAIGYFIADFYHSKEIKK